MHVQRFSSAAASYERREAFLKCHNVAPPARSLCARVRQLHAHGWREANRREWHIGCSLQWAAHTATAGVGAADDASWVGKALERQRDQRQRNDGVGVLEQSG